MMILNTPYYREPHAAPQMHTGSIDLLPSDNTGLDPLSPAGLSLSAPSPTWGAAIVEAPAPGAGGTSRELIALWGGLPATFPATAADLRLPNVFSVKERPEGHRFPTMSEFRSKVAARQQELGQAVPCFDAIGTRYDDLNTAGFADASAGAETRDVFRISDNVKVGEAFIYRANAAQTVQHWVLFNNERLTDVRVERRLSGAYSSLHQFFSALTSQRVPGVKWPHAVETVTHYLSCPW